MDTRFAAAFFGLILVGCVSAPPPPVNPLKVSEDVLLLQQQLREQRQDIERLTAAVDALSSINKEKKVRPTKKLKVTKLIPPVEEAESEAERESERSLEDEGQRPVPENIDGRVVDSRHEGMHFYYRGWQELSQGHYERAIQNLREFLKANPDHVYADRAEFLVTESHFRNQEYGQAVIAANRLESRFPTSLRLPEALYKKGLAYRKMGQQAEANRTFRDLIKRFPDDPHADSSRLIP